MGCLLGLALVLTPHAHGAADRVVGESSNEPMIELDEETGPMIELDDPGAPPGSTQRPFRATFGRSQLYLPSFFHPVNGKYDLLIHFHGMGSLQEANVERAHLNAAVVSINVGMGSGPYEEAFRNPYTFPRLVGYSAKLIEHTSRARGAHLGRIAVSGWSAGYGSIASILRQPDNVKRIDAVLLEDCPHSDWADEKNRIVSDAPLAKYQRIAEAAIAGDKLFAITHSSIHTEGYPSTSETIGELLNLVKVDRVAHFVVGPREMREIYEADKGDFHVKGYEGDGIPDHIDHIRAMAETVFPYLKQRWER
jgi:hypothetical protein